LLDAPVERCYPKLYEDRVIAERLDQAGLRRCCFVYQAENGACMPGDVLVSLTRKKSFLPDPRPLWSMGHGKDIVGMIAKEDLGDGRLRKQRMQNLHDFLFPVHPVQVAEPGIVCPQLRPGLLENDGTIRRDNAK